MTTTITIRKPSCFHMHLRQESMMEMVVRIIALLLHYVVVMPNTKPPILTAEDAHDYYCKITDEAKKISGDSLKPLMAIQITPTTTPAIIKEAKRQGVMLGKVYPFGVTTNSKNGVRNYYALGSVFRAMEECDLILSLHPEDPDPTVEGLYKETSFIKILEWIVQEFPKLRVVVEHVTTAEMVKAVKRLHKRGARIGATITIHHLMITLDHVIGYAEGTEKMKPHHFCKPIAKMRADLEALLKVALSAHPAFFFGSDSAPHPVDQKECAECCAGIFSAPVMIQLLAELFDQYNCLENLEAFVSINGCSFYELSPPTELLTLVNDSWVVPERYGNVVPFWAGKIISWQVQPS